MEVVLNTGPICNAASLQCTPLEYPAEQDRPLYWRNEKEMVDKWEIPEALTPQSYGFSYTCTMPGIL